MNYYLDIVEVFLFCQAFEGMTTLARHRLGIYIQPSSLHPWMLESCPVLVNEALKTQIAQIHAFTQVHLSITTLFEAHH